MRRGGRRWDDGAVTPSAHDDTDRTPPARPTARRPRRAVRRGTETTSVPGASADERPAGWGDDAAHPDAAAGANDDRLLRDVPPHYGRH